MDSRASGRPRRRRLLKVSFVLVACFAAGVIAAGAMAGASPLSVLSSLSSSDTTSTDTTTDATGTDTTTTDTTSTTTTTDSTPTDTTPTDTTSTETTPAPPGGTPSITSDKDDYAPGATVTLTGANWQPSEAVHIFVNDDEGKTW